MYKTSTLLFPFLIGKLTDERISFVFSCPEFPACDEDPPDELPLVEEDADEALPELDEELLNELSLLESFEDFLERIHSNTPRRTAVPIPTIQ
jgi:hypothetical protein